jgi:hypothetical protein
MHMINAAAGYDLEDSSQAWDRESARRLPNLLIAGTSRLYRRPSESVMCEPSVGSGSWV